MEVVAEAIALETRKPDIGTSFESKALAELPIPIGDNSRARAIDSFLFLTPGVTGDSFSHRISGGVDFQNEVVFNGVAAGQQFPGNILPKVCMSTISQGMLRPIPDPTWNGI